VTDGTTHASAQAPGTAGTASALRVLLVDDEPLARRRLRRQLAGEPGVEVVGECGTGAEAVAEIARAAPDLVLLDVQMPELDGFEVVERLGPSSLPLVVFVTAYDEYAVRAFDAAALDYLVKPVRRSRLRTALARTRERIAWRAAAAPAIAPATPPEREAPPAPAPPPSDRLLVDRGRYMEVVDVDAIDWVEAADNHVVVHVGRERHRFRRTMEQVLERLPADRFVRVHRSTIVNLSRVRQVHAWFHGGYLLVLADGTKLATGRQFRAQVMERLHLLR
jgi:two-component system, LytTR family, response regulator